MLFNAILVGEIFILTCVVLFALLLIVRKYDEIEGVYRASVPLEGRVVRIESKVPSDTEYLVPIVAFEFEGVTRQSPVDGFCDLVKIGDTMQILVTPDGKAYRPSSRGLTKIIAALLIAGIICAYIFLIRDLLFVSGHLRS